MFIQLPFYIYTIKFGDIYNKLFRTQLQMFRYVNGEDRILVISGDDAWENCWADTGRCKKAIIYQDIFLDPNIHTALWTLGGKHFFFIFGFKFNNF